MSGVSFVPSTSSGRTEIFTRFEKKIQATLARVWGEYGKGEEEA
jgi:hypothetical protein